MADKNEENATNFGEIVKIDDKEESLQTLKRQYEQQLTHFPQKSRASTIIMATLLALPSSRQMIEQIESENRTIQRQVNSYVDEELDELGKQTKKARRTFDEAREELISERNRLPWGKYSAQESQELIQAMTNNLQVANEVTDRLSSVTTWFPL